MEHSVHRVPLASGFTLPYRERGAFCAIIVSQASPEACSVPRRVEYDRKWTFSTWKRAHLRLARKLLCPEIESSTIINDLMTSWIGCALKREASVSSKPMLIEGCLSSSHKNRNLLPGVRRVADYGRIVLVALLLLVSQGTHDGLHAAEPSKVVPPIARTHPAAGSVEQFLKPLVDSLFALEVGEIRLEGWLDSQDASPRTKIEEIGIWPDYFSRSTDEGSHLPCNFQRMRFRSLFVYRYLAQAARRAAPVRKIEFAGQEMLAVEARDAHGSFFMIWGGLTGGLQGIQAGAERVYFLASARLGPWYYPAVQSYEANGTLTEVLRFRKRTRISR